MTRIFFGLAGVLLALTASGAQATLDPCTTNTEGKAPKVPFGCTAEKTSSAIQAAECSHNTRVSGTQAFAVFITSHQYDGNNGAPYGDCTAYVCSEDVGNITYSMETNSDAWTFFWGDNGESSDTGTGCIRDPTNGVCGCENSDGTFISGGSNCS